MERTEYSLYLENGIYLNIPDRVLEILQKDKRKVFKLKVDGVKKAIFETSKPWVELLLEDDTSLFDVLDKIQKNNPL